MSLVNYESDSNEEEIEEEIDNASKPTIHRLKLPTPSHSASNRIVVNDVDEDDDAHYRKINVPSNSGLLSNLPKPQFASATSETREKNMNSVDFTENELEDIVRGENKEYAKDIPQLPKPAKRKRDGPVKIFIPNIEKDSDDDEEEKKQKSKSKIKRGCALLSSLPPPIHEKDKPSESLPVVKNPSKTTPQISSTGLFIPYTVKKKPQQNSSSVKINQSNDATKNESDIEEEDDNCQTDFLGLTKSSQIEVTHADVESVLRETFTKIQPTITVKPSEPEPAQEIVDLDDEEPTSSHMAIQDDDELLRHLPKSERYREIKHVHIDSMLSDSAQLQLLKSRSEERETMKAQAAIHVPKGEMRKRAQISYLIAKAKHDDLQLKNMWSEQKLTKRQTQAKYGF